MTPTTQLRVLRTSLTRSAITSPNRASTGFVVAPSRRVQQPECPLHATRKQSFATTRFKGPATPTTTKDKKTQTAASATPRLHNSTPRAQSSVAPTTTKATTAKPATPTTPTISFVAANPPPFSRPPLLDVPQRADYNGTFRYYFSLGKAYSVFYKQGVINIYKTARLVWSFKPVRSIPSSSSSTTDDVTTPVTKRFPGYGSTSRAELLLRRRCSHDLRRAPLFALLVLICGEFTPLIVMALPNAVPFTCRIPKQIISMCEQTEARRRTSFAKLQGRGPALSLEDVSTPTITAHLARSLGLVSTVWDKLGVSDSLLAVISRRRVQGHLSFLAEDTRLLRQAGGVDALEDPELIYACADRGIDVVPVDLTRLRSQLRDWHKRAESAGPTGITSDNIAQLLLVPATGK